jgi:hypothetical protein
LPSREVLLHTIREVPHGCRLFCSKTATAPFETATGLLAVWTGVTSFLGYGIGNLAFDASLQSDALVQIFNLIYILSGAAILAGLGWSYRNVEASGIILLLTSLVIRIVAVSSRIGFNAITTTVIIQGVFFGIACFVRLMFLLRNRVTIRAGDIIAPETRDDP